MEKKGVINYLKDVRQLFPIVDKDERLYLKYFETRVYDTYGNDVYSYDECVEKFGNPKGIVISYFEEIETEDILRKIKKKQYITYIASTIIACIVILSLLIAYFAYQNYLQVKDQIVVEEVCEMEISE